jgi:hypothetical protein
MDKKDSQINLAPDKRKLTARQAERVSMLSGVAAKDLQGATIADITERLKWRIDPQLLFLKRICGRVVKTDPVTGIDQPVPFATVHVEDTDCNFLGFFPVESPFWWFFPLHCRREEIATTQTDECGNFCVWIPWFDIDWILRFRRRRRCFPDLFYKPTLAEIVQRFKADDLDHARVAHGNPNPPDPSPEMAVADPRTLRRVEETLGRQVAERLLRSQPSSPFLGGEQAEDASANLDRPAYPRPVPPPRPIKLRDVHNEEGNKGVARMLGISGKRAEMLNQLNFQKAVGPFWKCKDIYYLEFVPFFDVPDITFRVTQDVDGDGDEETIYSEGLFDVRWNSGSIPSVTLHANELAVSVPNCDPPPNVGTCATPGLVLVGQMPLINPPTGGGNFPYINSVNGYAVRPNRPHASGREGEVVDPATIDAASPLAYLMEFWGCNHRTSTGVTPIFYKVLRETSTDDGATWTSPVPVFDSWMLFRSVGSPPVLEWRTISADADGWYPVVNPNQLPAEHWLPSDDLILQWHPSNAPNGFHRLSLLLGDAAKNALETSPSVPVRVDNSGVNASFFKMEWRKLPGGAWQDLSFNCPVIHRQGQSIELRLTIHATAEHLRSVHVGASGCGDGNAPVLVSGFEPYQSGVPAGVHTSSYWHKSRSDNNFSNDGNPVTYRIDASFAAGAYSFSATAYSRAFFAGSGHVFDPTQSDLNYNPVWYGSYPTIPIAIVD